MLERLYRSRLDLMLSSPYLLRLAVGDYAVYGVRVRGLNGTPMLMRGTLNEIDAAFDKLGLPRPCPYNGGK